ncbi:MULTISPECIES: hypothetical protein [Empedobacter]|uniref:Lipoprotein n=2 Tax=Empedobacter TaxID=59734 RepID=A0A7H9DRV4_9FLAO|nr:MULTISPECIES: hypothetical protein [Empedobacter]MDH2208714.1 hypothetical protein [Empedobacter sp. GD03644]QLL57745.1 hypothetical protein FH779_06480 [Empedobacter falsenii]
MKKIILMSIFSSIISFISCKSNEDKYAKENSIIYFETKEFEEFEKKSPIKLEEAWNIQKKYMKKNNQIPENWLFFVINDYYVFNSSINPKEAIFFKWGLSKFENWRC